MAVIMSKAKYGKKSKKNKNQNVKKAIGIVIAVVLVVAIAFTSVIYKDNIKAFINRFTVSSSDSGGSKITTHSSQTVQLTFPEGYTVKQIADKLEKNEVCSSSDFIAAVNSGDDSVSISNPAERPFLLEGYVFPDTYDFYLGEDAKSVLKKFINNYNKKVTPEIKAKAEKLGFSMDEMIILASVIQKECDRDITECKNVSSVFHNRLKQSRSCSLGSDATKKYIVNLASYLGGEKSDDYKYFYELYNTNSGHRKGLPAGPICCPSIKAINAAVSPSKSDYYYFLTDAAGKNFYYAKTYKQHLANGKKAGILS